MSRLSAIVLAIVCVSTLVVLTIADGDSSHKKVLIHVPFKIHTVHHHHVKKIPVYHYYEDHDHHHHYHHHHEKSHHHIEEEDGHGWD